MLSTANQCIRSSHYCLRNPKSKGSSLTLVPDGVLRGVDLRPRLLLDPGQGCGSGPLGSFAGGMSNVLRSRAALHLIGLGAAVL